MQSQESQMVKSRARSHSVQSEPKDQKTPIPRRERSKSITLQAIKTATNYEMKRKNSEDKRIQRADSRKRLKSRSSDEGISEQLEGTKI